MFCSRVVQQCCHIFNSYRCDNVSYFLVVCIFLQGISMLYFRTMLYSRFVHQKCQMFCHDCLLLNWSQPMFKSYRCFYAFLVSYFPVGCILRYEDILLQVLGVVYVLSNIISSTDFCVNVILQSCSPKLLYALPRLCVMDLISSNLISSTDFGVNISVLCYAPELFNNVVIRFAKIVCYGINLIQCWTSLGVSMSFSFPSSLWALYNL